MKHKKMRYSEKIIVRKQYLSIVETTFCKYESLDS